MVVFNELALSEDRKTLTVECSVDELNIYSGMYIRSVFVEYYGNGIVPGTPSDKSILLYDGTDESVRNLHLTLSATGGECKDKFGIEDFTGGLFLVTVDCDGTIGAGAAVLPCGYDVYRDTAALYDQCLLYKVGMQHIAYANSDTGCTDMAGFNDFVTLWHMLRVSSEAGDYAMLEKIWKKFLRGCTGGTSVPSSSCGCNG